MQNNLQMDQVQPYCTVNSNTIGLYGDLGEYFCPQPFTDLNELFVLPVEYPIVYNQFPNVIKTRITGKSFDPLKYHIYASGKAQLTTTEPLEIKCKKLEKTKKWSVENMYQDTFTMSSQKMMEVVPNPSQQTYFSVFAGLTHLGGGYKSQAFLQEEIWFAEVPQLVDAVEIMERDYSQYTQSVLDNAILIKRVQRIYNAVVYGGEQFRTRSEIYVPSPTNSNWKIVNPTATYAQMDIAMSKVVVLDPNKPVLNLLEIAYDSLSGKPNYDCTVYEITNALNVAATSVELLLEDATSKQFSEIMWESGKIGCGDFKWRIDIALAIQMVAIWLNQPTISVHTRFHFIQPFERGQYDYAIRMFQNVQSLQKGHSLQKGQKTITIDEIAAYMYGLIPHFIPHIQNELFDGTKGKFSGNTLDRLKYTMYTTQKVAQRIQILTLPVSTIGTVFEENKPFNLFKNNNITVQYIAPGYFVDDLPPTESTYYTIFGNNAKVGGGYAANTFAQEQFLFAEMPQLVEMIESIGYYFKNDHSQMGLTQNVFLASGVRRLFRAKVFGDVEYRKQSQLYEPNGTFKPNLEEADFKKGASQIIVLLPPAPQYLYNMLEIACVPMVKITKQIIVDSFRSILAGLLLIELHQPIIANMPRNIRWHTGRIGTGKFGWKVHHVVFLQLVAANFAFCTKYGNFIQIVFHMFSNSIETQQVQTSVQRMVDYFTTKTATPTQNATTQETVETALFKTIEAHPTM